MVGLGTAALNGRRGTACDGTPLAPVPLLAFAFTLGAAMQPNASPRIVVTNHDPGFLTLLRDLLTDEGYEALLPPDLADPYPFVKETQPALIILDVVYRREAEALTTLDKLKLDPATTAIPVLVCTTTPKALEGVAARQEAGDLTVLTKPFNLSDLLRAVASRLAARG